MPTKPKNIAATTSVEVIYLGSKECVSHPYVNDISSSKEKSLLILERKYINL